MMLMMVSMMMITMLMIYINMMRDLTVTGIILFDCLFLDVAYHSIGHLSANIIWRMTLVIMVIMVNVIIMINMFNIIITIIMIIAVITIVGFVKKG